MGSKSSVAARRSCGGRHDQHANLAEVGHRRNRSVSAVLSAVAITNQANPLTVKTEDNGGGLLLPRPARGSPTASPSTSVTRCIMGRLWFLAMAPVRWQSNAELRLSRQHQRHGSNGDRALISPMPSVLVTLNPTLGGNEEIQLEALRTSRLGSNPSRSPSPISIVPGALNINNMTITDTDTGVVTLALAFRTGPPFPGTLSSAVTASVHRYSTNAVAIDATKSGGIVMDGGRRQLRHLWDGRGKCR